MKDKTVRILNLSDEQVLDLLRGSPIFMENQVGEVLLVCNGMSKEEIIAQAEEAFGADKVIVMGKPH